MVSDRKPLKTRPAVTTLDAETLRRGAAEFGISLGSAQIDKFQRYYRTLLEWNAKMNLTSVTEWEQVQRRHFVDSLSLSRVVKANYMEDCRFIDVGSGAGLPGIPLKIAFPDMTGILMDATAKKVQFLKSMIDTLRLNGVEAHHGRSEELARQPELREKFDLVVARAVAPMPVLAELTLPFCRPGGHAAVHKTSSAAGEIEDARYAINVLSGEISDIIDTDLDGSDSRRLLVVIEKTGPTPDAYPRRPGIPAKRPLSRP